MKESERSSIAEPIEGRCFVLTEARVLLLSSDGEEAQKWEEMFREYATLRIAMNLDELRINLERDSYDALFCGWSFQKGTWNDALRQVQSRCPELPVVVFSGTADQQEWAQVLESGAFDLLVAPYQRRAVIPIPEQAVASSEARRFHGTGSYSRRVHVE